MPQKKITLFLLSCLVVAWVTAAYMPSLTNGFTEGDDNIYVVRNNAVKDLSLTNTAKIFSTFHFRLYKPLTLFSFAIERHFFGLDPFFYHLDNLILHLLNCLMVGWLFLLLSGDTRIAFFMALLFGLHPMHVESVAWVAERKDMLYAFFMLGAAVAYCYHKNIAVCVLFALSLMAKPAALTFPLFLYAIDHLRYRKNTIGTFLEKVPVVAIAAIFFAVNLYAHFFESGAGRQGSLTGFPENILNACYVLVFYVSKLLVPLKLAAAYPAPTPNALLLSLAVALLAALAVKISLRFTRKVMFGALIFFITVLPVLQVVTTAFSLVQDRYTYIPSLGIFYILSAGFFRVYRKCLGRAAVLRIAMAAGAISVAMLLTAMTYKRTEVWRDSVTLWDDTLKKYPSIPEAECFLGAGYLAQGDAGKAMKCFRKSLVMGNRSIVMYLSLGAAYYKTSQYDKAISCYDKAIRVDPRLPELYHERALALLKKKDLPGAIRDFSRAIELEPAYEDAYYLRGNCCLELGDYKNTVKDYLAAYDLSPSLFSDPKFFFQLGYAYQALGQADQALQAYTKALEMDKRDPELYYYRGYCFDQERKYGLALSDYNKAIALRPGYAEAYLNRGIIFAGYGRTLEAITDFTRSIALDPGSFEAYYNRAFAYFEKKEYDKCWDDIHKIESLGAAGNIDQKFLARLKELSGRGQ